MSVYHCSYTQAVAAVAESGNMLFDRNWKYSDNSEEHFDLDTVPTNKQLREAGKAILSLTLKEIVDEMMASDDVVVTYHNDGSKKTVLVHSLYRVVLSTENIELFRLYQLPQKPGRIWHF